MLLFDAPTRPWHLQVVESSIQNDARARLENDFLDRVEHQHCKVAARQEDDVQCKRQECLCGLSFIEKLESNLIIF